MTHVEEQLDEIVALLEKGFSVKEIMHRLGVSTSDWQEYQRTHPKFKKKMDGIKKARICQLHEIMWTLAQGYDYQDTTTVTKVNRDGNEVTTYISYKRHVPPSLDACVALLEFLENSKAFETADCLPLSSASSPKAYEPSKEPLCFSTAHTELKPGGRKGHG